MTNDSPDTGTADTGTRETANTEPGNTELGNTEPGNTGTGDTGTGSDGDAPTLRQRLHSATGDRDAEAEALADRAGDEVSDEDAKVAVELAHGDLGNAVTDAETELASAQDAREVSDDRSRESPPRL